MEINKTQTKKSVVEVHETRYTAQDRLPKQLKSPELTFGQRLADKMTEKIGSWAFLTVQSSVLAVWITLNSIPGVPHWDNNPFVLLNLVFSFASAYTAPVVLMSQNRQSEEDRKIAEANLEVNVRAGKNIELLHGKIEAMQAEMVKKQQQLQEIKEQQRLKEAQMSVLLPLLNVQASGLTKEFSEYKSSNLNKSAEENTALINDLFR